MQIQAGFQAYGPTNTATNVGNSSAYAATANRFDDSTSGNVAVSEAAKRLSQSESIYTVSTGQGDRDVDLDTFFQRQPVAEADLFDTSKLLLPNAQNIQALQDHLSKIFPDFLARHDIPEAPESIRYDQTGQLVLPADYPYADQLKQALAQEESIAYELRALNALSSHYAAIKELEPFHEAAAAATSQAELDALIEQFSHLLRDDRSYPSVELTLSSEGQVTATSEGNRLA